MPAGQANSRIDAGLGIAPVDTREINRVLESATPRLEAAWKAGIIRYEDILDAATTKPKARAALMAQLDAQRGQAELAGAQIAGAKARLPVTEKTADDTAVVDAAMAARAAQRVGTVNDALDAKARSESANAKLGAAIDEAVTAGVTPDAIQGVANAKLDTMRFGAAAGAMQAQRTASDMERAMLSNPTRDALSKMLLEEGHLVDPKETDADVATRVRDLIEAKRKRELEAELLKGRMSAAVSAVKDTRDRTLAMYNTYAKDERIANAVTVKTQYGIVRRMLENGASDPTGASDMAAVFSFMKMLDPTSVVREGEYIRASKASAIIDRWMPAQIWDRLSKGVLLTPDQRVAFLQAANQAVQSHIDAAQNIRAATENTATMLGVDPRAVTGSLDFSVPKFSPNQALGDPGPGNVWLRKTGKEGKPDEYIRARAVNRNGKTEYEPVTESAKPPGGQKVTAKTTDNGDVLIHAPAGSPAAAQFGF